MMLMRYPHMILDRTLAGDGLGQADQCVRYINDAAVKHVRESIGSDCKSDDLVLNAWLGDYPPDIITLAVAEVVGQEKLEELIAASEAANELWALACRAVIMGFQCKRLGQPQESFKWHRRGLDALEKLSASDADGEQRQAQDGLELLAFSLLSSANDATDASRIPRMVHVLQQDAAARAPTYASLCHLFVGSMALFGDPSSFGATFMRYLSALSTGARSHADSRMQQLCKLFLVSAGLMQPSISNTDWDWDTIFLDQNGENFVQQVYKFYTYEKCHNFLVQDQGTWGKLLCKARSGEIRRKARSGKRVRRSCTRLLADQA